MPSRPDASTPPVASPAEPRVDPLHALRARVTRILEEEGSQEAVDSLIAALKRGLPHKARPQDYAELLQAIVETPEVARRRGTRGEWVRQVAAEALQALGAPYARELPREEAAEDEPAEPAPSLAKQCAGAVCVGVGSLWEASAFYSGTKEEPSTRWSGSPSQSGPDSLGNMYDERGNRLMLDFSGNPVVQQSCTPAPKLKFQQPSLTERLAGNIAVGAVGIASKAVPVVIGVVPVLLALGVVRASSRNAARLRRGVLLVLGWLHLPFVLWALLVRGWGFFLDFVGMVGSSPRAGETLGPHVQAGCVAFVLLLVGASLLRGGVPDDSEPKPERG